MNRFYLLFLFIVIFMGIVGAWMINDVVSGLMSANNYYESVCGDRIDLEVGNGFYSMNEVQAFHVGLWFVMASFITIFAMTLFWLRGWE